jgi:uncharacterized protein
MKSRIDLMTIHAGRFGIFPWTIIFASLLCFSGCSRTSRNNAAEPLDRLVMERQEKDIEFKSGRDSPIPEKDRASFSSLAYFDLNAAFRFRTKLNRYFKPERIRLSTNTGEIHSALKYGYFEFEIKGETYKLQVYRVEDVPEDAGGPYLFVPFRDATNGRETYEAGRYIDLKENTSGIYDLDFNRAYNPYCAYGKGYSCPLPPAENTIPIKIEAGEKKYPLAGGR